MNGIPLNNPLIGEENRFTMDNVGAVLAYVNRTLAIQHEAQHCPDFDLAPYTPEEMHGLLQICRMLEEALKYDKPEPVFILND